MRYIDAEYDVMEVTTCRTVADLGCCKGGNMSRACFEDTPS